MTPDDPDFWRHALLHHRPELYPDSEETTMTDQFTPNEAELIHGYSHGGEDSNNFADRRERREEAQRAIAKLKEVAVARLIAEAETQWGVESINADGHQIVEPVESEGRARHLAAYYRIPLASRRILRTAWTTDEEGK